MTAFVEIRGLRKVYSRRRGEDVVAVQGLDLDLGRPGSVHGFLGPNGSGKTTTIRCLLGLIRPTEGAVRVFGADSRTDFHRVAGRIGAIVENPKMFPSFSARRNLNLLATMGGLPRTEVDRVLDIVGLRDRDGDSFKSYSLGMKQRLAIAAALLKNPDLLILDEPANGLDPAGIAEMRLLIGRIAAEGKAVVVSSHQLAEIEQVCDDVTIINQGHLIESGPLEHIKSFGGEDNVLVTIDERDAAVAVLQEMGLPARPRSVPDELVVEIDVDRASDVTKVLSQRGLYLRGMRPNSVTLEEAFLNLTGGPPPPMGAQPAPAPVAPGGYPGGPPPGGPAVGAPPPGGYPGGPPPGPPGGYPGGPPPGGPGGPPGGHPGSAPPGVAPPAGPPPGGPGGYPPPADQGWAPPTPGGYPPPQSGRGIGGPEWGGSSEPGAGDGGEGMSDR